VAFVHGLEKGHLGLTRQIHILSTVGNELHKSSRHDRFVLVPKKKIISKLIGERKTAKTRLYA
jgi:hypothetical protein